MAYPVCLVCVSDRCQEVGSEDRRREKREDKCPFLENSGSEEDVLQILQYMATILGKYVKLSKMCVCIIVYLKLRKGGQGARGFIHVTLVYELIWL